MSTSAKQFPLWGFFLLVTNGILMLAIVLLVFRQQALTNALADNTSLQPVSFNTQSKSLTPELGPRHKLNYQQWQDILKQEAKAVAAKPQENLTILAGDSLTLWFPPELLPEDRNWLNQGISGETSAGLLKRLEYFDNTKPEIILVMIGINDLIRGVKDEEILDNQRQIISYLRKQHPQSKIFLQSILPHGSETATWEGKDKFLNMPNTRIRNLNKELEKIADQQGVEYLNLYPLFSNNKGDMRPEFSTDGLHLNPQGYTVWRTALQIYTKPTQVTRISRSQEF
ncbi:MAG: G-D-S-L family lipolytic protein [Nostocales cyanobacterium]|nr:MAG: G-D-S-L family lipolytic protein [Nostocales cyanobacterium]TAF19793.1 MAG: G-D-S-L family lipolytic protein [Nostocales cyanobacterium]